MPPQPPPGISSFQANISPMPVSSIADAHLRSGISPLTTAQPYTPSKPIPVTKGGMFEAKQWSAAAFEAKQWTGSASPAKGTSRRQNKAARATPAAATPTPVTAYTNAQVPSYTQQTPQMPRPAVAPPPPPPVVQVPRPSLPTTPQALVTSYASRMRTGTTLLMQPILASTSNMGAGSSRTGTRRGGVISYAELDSGDEIDIEPDAGERDRNSDDSDFVASGGTRSALRAARGRTTAGTNGYYHHSFVRGSPAPQTQGKHDLGQSYLGQIPPSKFITAKRAEPTKHEYPSQEALENQALKPTALVPIRVEFETETHRIRDCFMWDLNDDLVKPETFARIFCADLDLPQNPWVETITNQIRAQVEEYEGIASMDLGSNVDGYAESAVDGGDLDIPECRVILSVDVQIGTYHLMDHIEWDLLSPLTPEIFAKRLCADIGLTGEAAPLIAHAIHEEILKHKKDAIEWGVIGGDASIRDVQDESAGDREKREKFGLKDKSGLGLGPGSWGRAPRDGLGRGPRALKGMWKDWNDAEEYATRFEVLTPEEVERREIERERASRRLRRETSKFQFNSTRRRR